MRKKHETKFPVARIKKIMQLDEEVGKVAVATPILISKALEVFMQELIDKGCKEAVALGAEKKLAPFHLKKVIEENENFDFLLDLVKDIQDLPPPSNQSRRLSSSPPSKKTGGGGKAGENGESVEVSGGEVAGGERPVIVERSKIGQVTHCKWLS